LTRSILSQPKLVLPRQGSVATVFSKSLASRDIVDYDNGDSATQSLMFPGIGRGVCDPRLGYFTT